MTILEKIYYTGFLLRQNYSKNRMKHLPCRVISIGNLTVGGTGKTPAAIAVSGEALSRGLFPVVLTRGYRGRAKGPCFVSDGGGPLLSAEDAGDEPYLMATIMPAVPVVKSASRYEGGMFAIDRLSKTVAGFTEKAVFILDDGFQHLTLHRDKDIVLIDAEDPFGNCRLLPLGRLREPVEALDRADMVIITKGGKLLGDRGPEIEKTIAAIRENNTRVPIFIADHLPDECFNIHGGKEELSSMAGKRVFGFCGIGSPESFRKTLQAAGAEVAGLISFRDHHRYTEADIRNIMEASARAESQWIVTTEKDIIKVREFDLPGNILIIRVRFSVDRCCYDEIFRLD
ncbi:MAG: tetraacyldisaccharide 4'-kinase [Nitrospirae bacterium]|nr:tetraacyldisaccharide 4'-kinase [Nitrospirota bacterium]